MRSSLTGEDYGTIPGEPVQTNMGNRFMAVCTGRIHNQFMAVCTDMLYNRLKAVCTGRLSTGRLYNHFMTVCTGSYITH